MNQVAAEAARQVAVIGGVRGATGRPFPRFEGAGAVARPSAWAPLMVAAEMASAGVMPIRRQASAIAVCMFSVGVWSGLKLVARATAAPASMSARAGAFRGRRCGTTRRAAGWPWCRNPPADAHSDGLAYSRWSMLDAKCSTAAVMAAPPATLVGVHLAGESQLARDRPGTGAGNPNRSARLPKRCPRTAPGVGVEASASVPGICSPPRR